MNANDELKTQLCSVLGMSLDTQAVELLTAVSDLVELRRKIESETARERRILDLQATCHCTRETALSIMAAQGTP